MKRLSEIRKQAKSLDLNKEVEALLCDVLSLSREELFMKGDFELSEDELRVFEAQFERLLKGVPLAYIRGKADFYGYEFLVNENVLIPRRDTEILVHESVDRIKKLNKVGCEVVELGLGSGCISLSIAKELIDSGFSEFSITGVEKYDGALKVAQKNLQAFDLGDKVSFIKGDLLSGIASVDVLVANLPYIAFDDKEVADDVRSFEPHTALFADEAGLKLYRLMLEQVRDQNLTPNIILFEIGYNQGESAVKLAQNILSNYKVKIITDLEGRDRVIALELN